MHIYAAHMLQQYWDEEGEFRPAFLRWADAIIDNHDDAKRRIRPQNNDGWRVRVEPHVRAAVREQHGNGVTFRQLAERHSLTLRQVVTILRPGASGHAEDYAAMEEELLACGPPTAQQSAWADFNVKHGFGVSTRAAQRLARAHGLPVEQAQRGGYRKVS